MSLGWYLSDASALLHDSSHLFTSQAQLTRWVNEARRQCAARSGCIRRLISGQSAFGASAQPGSAVPGGMQPGAVPDAFPAGTVANAAINSFQTIPGQERYSYIGYINEYAKAQHAGIGGVVDLIALSVNWGGSIRPTLAWMPWDDLQAYARAYAYLVESYPSVWSCYSDGEDGEAWLFPCPSTIGEMEADAFCYPKDLYTDSDYDAIPGGFRNAIKFGAASLACMASQRFAQAEYYAGLFNDRIGVGRVSADRGKTPSYYVSSF